MLKDGNAAQHSEKHVYLKNTAYVLAANFVVLVFAFFSRPLIARFLGPSEYGLFALIFSTSGVIPSITLLSLNFGVLFLVAKKPEKAGEIVSSCLWFLLVLTALLAIPLYFLSFLFAPTLGFYGFVAAYFLAFSLSLFTVLQASQQGLERFKQYSATNALTAGGAAVLTVLAAYFFRTAFAGALARAGILFIVSLAGFYLLKQFGSFRKDAFTDLWRYSSPLAFAAFLFSLIMVVDRYIIAAFYPTSEVGYYDISYSFATAILPLSTSLLATMAPKVIRDQSSLDKYFKRLSLANTILLTGFALALFYFSDIIVFLLLGKSYVGGATLPLKILAVALPLMAFQGLNVTVFNSLNKTKATAFLIVALVLASTVFNLLLVPGMGGVGAAWANFTAYFIVVAASLYYLKKNYSVTLGPTVAQMAVFAVFVLAYELFVGSSGFTAKVVFYALFALVTFALQKQIIFELAGEARKMLFRMR